MHVNAGWVGTVAHGCGHAVPWPFARAGRGEGLATCVRGTEQGDSPRHMRGLLSRKTAADVSPDGHVNAANESLPKHTERTRAGPVARIGAPAVLLAVFAIILFPARLTSNEELYLALAHRLVEPDAFGPFSAIPDSPRHLLAFSGLAGWVVSALGYEWAHVLLRLLQAIFFAFGYSLLATRLRLSLTEALIALALYLLVQHKVPGGEWLFHSVEAKTVAYGFVFVALAGALDSRWGVVLAGSVLATWYHFQVGGFWAAFALALYGLAHRQWRRAGALCLCYGVAVAPLVALLIQQQVPEAGTGLVGGLGSDQIYSIVRHPHHTSPFLPSQHASWALRTAQAALIYGLMLALTRRGRDSEPPHPAMQVARLLPFVAGFVLLAFGLSWFDRDSAFLGKFYLFRPVALGVLLSLLVIMSRLRIHERLGKRLSRCTARRASVVAALLAMLVIVDKAPNSILHAQAYTHEDLVAAVRQHTARNDLIVAEQVGHEDASLPRRFGRPTLVHWTFVPANPADIREWYRRILWRDRLFEAGCAPETLAAYPVRYVLVFRAESRSRMASCGTTIWSNGQDTLIRIGAAGSGADQSPAAPPR